MSEPTNGFSGKLVRPILSDGNYPIGYNGHISSRLGFFRLDGWDRIEIEKCLMSGFVQVLNTGGPDEMYLISGKVDPKKLKPKVGAVKTMYEYQSTDIDFYLKDIS